MTIRGSDTFFQGACVVPTQRVKPPTVHELSRCTVGLCRIEHQLGVIANDLGNRFCEASNCDLTAGADVNVLVL